MLDGGQGDGSLDTVLEGVSSLVGSTDVESAAAPVADVLDGATDNEGIGSKIFGNVNGVILRRQDGGEGDGVLDPALEAVSSLVGSTGVEGAAAPVADALDGATDNEGVGSVIFGNVNGIILRRDDGGEGDGVLGPVLSSVSSAVGSTGVEGDAAPVANALDGATDDEGLGSVVFGNVNGIVARQVEGGNGSDDIDNDNPLAVLTKTGSEFLDGLATVIS